MFSTDEIALFLNLTNRTKASQAFNPARRKMALAMIYDAERTLRDLLVEVELVRGEMAAAERQRHAARVSAERIRIV